MKLAIAAVVAGAVGGLALGAATEESAQGAPTYAGKRDTPSLSVASASSPVPATDVPRRLFYVTALDRRTRSRMRVGHLEVPDPSGPGPTLRTAGEGPDIGTTIRDYRLEQRAGRGGMGVVFRATQLSLGRRIALKLIAPEIAEDRAVRERFKREARLAAQIDHPNVVPVYQAGEHEGHLYIAMRYVDGTDLGKLVRAHGRLRPAHAVRIVEQVAAALDAAHEQGLVHRDVKPANVLLSGREGAEHAYLTDFGLTKRLTSSDTQTATGEFAGTLDYIAPEQLRGGTIDRRADVYALGCVLYELLTARVPFKRDSDVAKLYAHIAAPPPQPSRVVAALAGFDAVVRRAMAKDPQSRYTTAGELAAAARAAIRDAASTQAQGVSPVAGLTGRMTRPL